MLNDEKKTFEKKIDAVDSTVKENVKSMEEVFKFSVSFEIFRGVWAKFRIPPLRSVMFAIEQNWACGKIGPHLKPSSKH